METPHFIKVEFCNAKTPFALNFKPEEILKAKKKFESHNITEWSVCKKEAILRNDC